MKRFTWKLQRLLDVRSRQEELKKAELLALVQKIAAVRQNLLMRQAKLRQMFGELAQQEAQTRLRQQPLFLKAVAFADERIKAIKKQLEELETQRTAVMAQAIELRRFRKSLEKLRVAAKEEYDRETKKIEQQFLDETANIAFARAMLEHAGRGEVVRAM
jgi:flagellar export protein FliJ